MGHVDFYESAIRHWIGGCILELEEEYDSAICLLGFAAECALKAIMNWINCDGDVKKYSHLGEALFEDLKMLLLGDMTMVTLLEPGCGLRLSLMVLPPILFQGHPERRYFQDGEFSEDDVFCCREAVKNLIREMVTMRLDGAI